LAPAATISAKATVGIAENKIPRQSTVDTQGLVTHKQQDDTVPFLQSLPLKKYVCLTKAEELEAVEASEELRGLSKDVKLPVTMLNRRAVVESGDIALASSNGARTELLWEQATLKAARLSKLNIDKRTNFAQARLSYKQSQLLKEA